MSVFVSWAPLAGCHLLLEVEEKSYAPPTGTEADGAPDAASEPSPDVDSDATTDASQDVAVDTAHEAGGDAPSDAGSDVGSDVDDAARDVVEAAADSAPEAEPDTGSDAGLDAGADASSDAGLEAGIDAQADAGGECVVATCSTSAKTIVNGQLAQEPAVAFIGGRWAVAWRSNDASTILFQVWEPGTSQLLLPQPAGVVSGAPGTLGTPWLATVGGQLALVVGVTPVGDGGFGASVPQVRLLNPATGATEAGPVQGFGSQSQTAVLIEGVATNGAGTALAIVHRPRNTSVTYDWQPVVTNWFAVGPGTLSPVGHDETVALATSSSIAWFEDNGQDRWVVSFVGRENSAEPYVPLGKAVLYDAGRTQMTQPFEVKNGPSVFMRFDRATIPAASSRAELAFAWLEDSTDFGYGDVMFGTRATNGSGGGAEPVTVVGQAAGKWDQKLVWDGCHYALFWGEEATSIRMQRFGGDRVSLAVAPQLVAIAPFRSYFAVSTREPGVYGVVSQLTGNPEGLRLTVIDCRGL